MAIAVTSFLAFHSFAIRANVLSPKMIRTHKIVSCSLIDFVDTGKDAT